MITVGNPPHKEQAMDSTMSLYHKAMSINPNAGAWCETLGLSRNALAVAKLRGRLSPGLAGALASNMPNEDVQRWINIATIEGEQNTTIKGRLQRVLKL
jgi:hypothetical protein